MPPRSPRDGFHSVTPRILIEDVEAQVTFLRTVFGATGSAEPGRPTEILIGDSLVMVSPAAAERDPFRAFLYIYVDDADAAYQHALSMLVVFRWRSLSTRRMVIAGPWCATRLATSSRLPTKSPNLRSCGQMGNGFTCHLTP